MGDGKVKSSEFQWRCADVMLDVGVRDCMEMPVWDCSEAEKRYSQNVHGGRPEPV